MIVDLQDRAAHAYDSNKVDCNPEIKVRNLVKEADPNLVDLNCDLLARPTHKQQARNLVRYQGNQHQSGQEQKILSEVEIADELYFVYL